MMEYVFIILINNKYRKCFKRLDLLKLNRIIYVNCYRIGREI